jgi:hypothetical protein
MVNRVQKSRFLAAAIVLLLGAAFARAGEVNILSMGDWGNNGPGQRKVAATMKSYIQSSDHRFNAMLLAGDNFYVPLENVFDAKWRTMFEDLYD